jgi:hypothetical protein
MREVDATARFATPPCPFAGSLQKGTKNCYYPTPKTARYRIGDPCGGRDGRSDR